MIWILISVFFAATVLILLFRIVSIRKSLKEITTDLHRIVHADTNSVITTSSADPAVRQLAGKLNIELKELRQAQLRVENGTHELQTAVTNIAHDLRTPLTAISGYLELLEREKLGEKPEQYLGVIHERTDALKALTEELFRYSVIDDTVDALRPEPLVLDKELEIALAAAYQILSEKEIIPKISFPEEIVERSLDRKALQRIFSNILNNAAKYSDGDLSISLQKNGTIIFCNAASSLSEIEVGKLFDRFYTVESAKGSTGLGLSIAKLLTEKMGGSISAIYRDGQFRVEVRFP